VALRLRLCALVFGNILDGVGGANDLRGTFLPFGRPESAFSDASALNIDIRVVFDGSAHRLLRNPP